MVDFYLLEDFNLDECYGLVDPKVSLAQKQFVVASQERMVDGGLRTLPAAAWRCIHARFEDSAAAQYLSFLTKSLLQAERAKEKERASSKTKERMAHGDLRTLPAAAWQGIHARFEAKVVPRQQSTDKAPEKVEKKEPTKPEKPKAASSLESKMDEMARRMEQMEAVLSTDKAPEKVEKKEPTKPEKPKASSPETKMNEMARRMEQMEAMSRRMEQMEAISRRMAEMEATLQRQRVQEEGLKSAMLRLHQCRNRAEWKDLLRKCHPDKCSEYPEMAHEIFLMVQKAGSRFQ